ncbi:hypothetical protein EVAR_63806_1 [Eumeta japonica]|uniref:Reverse transcriptase domain-containing protein n=1 Tax=Eumeta variegata TaxID=151549 RepID=A0A4C1ZK73_EUMVA|nr:hypothetical protein EVAR_63806_1 [Eumeta japonica]
MTKGWVLIFIDNILMLAANGYKALEQLKETLKIASEYGLKMNYKKAQSMTKSITFLENKIDSDEVRPSGEKIEAVMKFPESRSVKEVQNLHKIGPVKYHTFTEYGREKAASAVMVRQVSESSGSALPLHQSDPPSLDILFTHS